MGLAVVVAGLTLAAIASGYVIIGRGDPSIRFLMSLRASTDLASFAGRWDNWNGDWPAGHFLIVGAWIRLMEWLGLRRPGALAQGTLVLSTLVWIATLPLVYSTVARVRDAAWGWIAVLGFLSIPHLTELAHNAYSEIYFVALYVATLSLLARFETGGRARWLVAAAVPVIVASTIRTEAVLLAAGIGGSLLLTRGWRAALIFVAASVPVTLARLLAQPALIASQVRVVPWPDRFYHLEVLALYLVVPNAIVLFVLHRVFAARATMRAPDPARAVALHAAYSGGLLIAFSFGAMLFLTRIDPKTRLFALPFAAGVIALACIAGAPHEAVWRSMRRWVAPWVLASSVAQVFLLGIDFDREPPRPPPGIRAAAAWLDAHGEPERLVAVDHVHFWESTLLVYGSRTIDEAMQSYLSWGDGSAPNAPPDAPPPTVGRFIAERHPSFVVRPTGSPVWRRTGEWGPEWAFLDARTSAGSARMTLHNADVEIYELIEAPRQGRGGAGGNTRSASTSSPQ